MTWTRTDFLWAAIEPTAGTSDWSRSDQLIAASSKTGVDVLAILDYSAPWASSDPSGNGDPSFPPRYATDYAAFAS